LLSAAIIGVMRRPSVIAHRGASGYEYENSRAAFRRAVGLDVDGVELDVHATRDGVIIVHHDPDIAGNGPLAQLSFAETQQIRLRNGETIPRLSEILDLVGQHDVWIEVKHLPESADTELLDALARGPAPKRYAVHSFDHRIIRRLGERQPELRRGILLSAYLTDPVAAMAAAGASTLWQEWHQIDQELVNLVHNAGGAVIAWTVNEIGDLQRLARLGVDGLCGNYPDRIRIALVSRGEEMSHT
jgi:glycerophosphoryl diester phosphodiesterase